MKDCSGQVNISSTGHWGRICCPYIEFNIIFKEYLLRISLDIWDVSVGLLDTLSLFGSLKIILEAIEAYILFCWFHDKGLVCVRNG